MSIVIREADLLADRTHLIREIRENLNPHNDDRRFDWLYLNNPHGRARIWIATDRETGTTVGTCAALPRLFYLRELERRGCVFADFWINPNYRSLGPALQLQRVCMAEVGRDGCLVAYDFPRKSMVAVYKRLGLEPRDQLIRYTKLLKFDRFLSARTGYPAVARLLSLLPNQWLAADRWRAVSSGYSVRVEPAMCGEEFSSLARRAAASYGLCVARTAEYLNWRYHEHFRQRHEIVTVRRGGHLAAYLVFIDHGEVAQVVDVFGEEDEDKVDALLSGAIAILRSRGICSIDVSLLSSDARVSVFRHMGFSPREPSPLVVCDPTHSIQGAADGSPARMFFMYGDEAD